MFERAENHWVGVLFIVPVIVLIAACTWTSIFQQWVLLVHKEAQYSATICTKDSAEVLRVPALHL